MCKWQIPKQYAYIDPTTPPGREFKRFGTPIVSDDHLKAVRKMTPHTGEYLSVYSWKKWIGGRITPEISKTADVDGIFLDFDDAEDPQRAIRDAAKVARYVRHCTCNFSGGKGAHVMIHCNPVDLVPDLKSHVIRKFVIEIVDNLTGLDTLDFAVVGDTSRVHRIIDSMHQKTKLHAIGLTAEELETLSIDEIKSMAANRRGLIQLPTPSERVSQELYRIEKYMILDRLWELEAKGAIATDNYRFIDAILQSPDADRAEIFTFVQKVEEDVRRTRASQSINLRGEIIGSSKEETWLIHAVRQFKTTGRAATGNRTSEHKARVHLAKLADECGWTTGEICDIFTGADDYDEEITERMVHSCIGMR